MYVEVAVEDACTRRGQQMHFLYSPDSVVSHHHLLRSLTPNVSLGL